MIDDDEDDDEEFLQRCEPDEDDDEPTALENSEVEREIPNRISVSMAVISSMQHNRLTPVHFASVPAGEMQVTTAVATLRPEEESLYWVACETVRRYLLDAQED